MMRWLILSLVPLLASAQQEDPARLLERLGSESQEERAKATKSLKALGVAALPALREARSSKDAEVASRAGALVSLIETELELPPRLRKAVPDLAERLASRELDWNEAILELSDREKHPWVRRSDLEKFLPRALADAGDEDERKGTILTLATRGFPAVAPHLIPLLSDPNVENRKAAISWLGVLDPASAPRIARLLKDPDSKVVETALQALSGQRSRAQLPEIAPLLKDERIWIRMAALQAVGNIGGPDSNRLVVPLLRDPQVDVRKQAAQSLLNSQDPSVSPLLLDLLADPDRETREAVLKILAHFGAREAGPEIVNLLDDGNIYVRREAVNALVVLRTPVVEKQVLALLDQPGAERQAEALRTLGRLRVFAARAPIARRLEAAAPEVRRAAIEALAALRDHESTPALLSRLGDADAGVRNAALAALVELGEESALPKIAGLLKDPASRAAALRGLGRMGARSEASRVAGFFDDPDKEVRNQAQTALQELDPTGYRERILPQIIKQLDDPEERESALIEAEQVGARTLLPRFIVHLEDESDKVRRAARNALVELGGADQIPPVLLLLKHANPQVREEAVRVLKDLGTKATARELRPLTRDANQEVRYEVIAALAALEGVDAAPMLEGLLGDPDLYVRCAAVFALSQIKARSSAAKIATLLQDPALEVRSTAAQALDGLDAREQAGELIRTLRNPESNGHGGCPYAYAQTAFRRWKPLEVLPQILDLLKESSAYVRSITLTTLDQMEAPIPEAVLVSLLDDPDPMIRQRACARLGEAGAKTAVPAIRALLDDPEDRLCAAGVLYDLGDARGTAELEKRLSDPDPSARAEAATTLGRTQALAGLLGSLDVWRQGPLMRTLADRNIREAIPEIVAQLAGPCRQAAAEALGRLHADAHAADLARLLQDADFSVRYEAAGALLKLDAGRASAALLAAIDREGGLLISQSREDLMTRLRPVDALIRRARDPDPILRERAIELLGKIGGPEARKAVAAALADPDPVVRRGAVEALSALDDVDPLAALLKDPNSIVRVAAAGALCLHGRKEAARVLLDEAERRTGVDLTPLNALRRPKEWAVLVGTKAGSPLSGRKPELFQSLAKLSGLKIDVLRDSHSGDAWVPAEESVAEAMERLLTRTPYALVVEEGRLRLLPRADSLAFWKAWAEGR